MLHLAGHFSSQMRSQCDAERLNSYKEPCIASTKRNISPHTRSHQVRLRHGVTSLLESVILSKTWIQVLQLLHYFLHFHATFAKALKQHCTKPHGTGAGVGLMTSQTAQHAQNLICFNLHPIQKRAPIFAKDPNCNYLLQKLDQKGTYIFIL